jgi:hypothetical protein
MDLVYTEESQIHWDTKIFILKTHYILSDSGGALWVEWDPIQNGYKQPGSEEKSLKHGNIRLMRTEALLLPSFGRQKFESVAVVMVGSFFPYFRTFMALEFNTPISKLVKELKNIGK